MNEFVKWWDEQRPKGTRQDGFSIASRAWQTAFAIGEARRKEEVDRLTEESLTWQNRAEKVLAKLYEHEAKAYKLGQSKMRARAAQEADRIHGEASLCGDVIASLELEEK